MHRGWACGVLKPRESSDGGFREKLQTDENNKKSGTARAWASRSFRHGSSRAVGRGNQRGIRGWWRRGPGTVGRHGTGAHANAHALAHALAHYKHMRLYTSEQVGRHDTAASLHASRCWKNALNRPVACSWLMASLTGQ